MSTTSGHSTPHDDATAASPISATPAAVATTASSRLRTVVRWAAILTAGAALSAQLVLEVLARPAYEVVILSLGAVQWRPILHLSLLASMCIALGTIAHQLARAFGRLERAAGLVLGALMIVSACGLVVVTCLFAVFASVRQYVTITADDGTRFLVRAITWHHTDYTILEPAGGPWYSDGASILTSDPNDGLASGEYALQRTATGYRLTFSPTPADGPWYELDW